MSRTTAQEVADAMEASHLSSASSDEAEETHGISSGPSRAARARRSSLEDRRLPPPLSPRVAQDSVRALEGSAAGRSSSSAHGRLHPPSQLDATLRRSGPEDMSRSTSGGAMLRRCSTESAHSLDFDSDPESFRIRPASIASRTSIGTSLQGVRIRDNSLEESASFARQVRISSFHTVGGSLGGFVAYECVITTTDGATIRRMKRYSAFCDLREDLLQAFPALTRLIDTLPRKSLAKYRPSFLEKRRKRLAYWLSTVLLHSQLGGSTQAKAWILE